MKLTLKARGVDETFEVGDDPTCVIYLDGHAVVGLLPDHVGDREVTAIGHWPNGEEWVMLAEAVVAPPRDIIREAALAFLHGDDSTLVEFKDLADALGVPYEDVEAIVSMDAEAEAIDRQYDPHGGAKHRDYEEN